MRKVAWFRDLLFRVVRLSMSFPAACRPLEEFLGWIPSVDLVQKAAGRYVLSGQWTARPGIEIAAYQACHISRTDDKQYRQREATVAGRCQNIVDDRPSRPQAQTTVCNRRKFLNPGVDGMKDWMVILARCIPNAYPANKTMYQYYGFQTTS